MYRNFLKRVLDLVLSVILILMLFLPMILISLIVLITDPGPVFYCQKRFGRSVNGEPKFFKIIKFRTMKVNTPDVPTDKLKNPEQYVTSCGKFLRKTSLDELPQLFNILLGQMSFVGPRPALWNQTKLMRLRDKNGSSLLRPGLTGWAQINGRDDISEARKARLDGEYASSISFAFDLKCFFLTFKKVAESDGVAG
ncbi:sugar transferase [Candidatus Saccharibacteria bacterium]|nr:sugar transferase [Candidatus Saccharibacteria bacterium]